MFRDHAFKDHPTGFEIRLIFRARQKCERCGADREIFEVSEMLYAGKRINAGEMSQKQQRFGSYVQVRITEEFFNAFSLELSRLQGSRGQGTTEQCIDSLYRLHHRFGREILQLIGNGLEHAKARLSEGTMARHSLLTLAVCVMSTAAIGLMAGGPVFVGGAAAGLGPWWRA